MDIKDYNYKEKKIRKDKGQKGKNAKKIVCVETEEVFESIVEAKEVYGKSIDRALKKGTEAKGLHFRYIDKDLVEYINPRLKRVQNVETGEIFESIKKAYQEYNNNRHIFEACKDSKRKVAGYHWRYVD
jgi:hypothetical protein